MLSIILTRTFKDWETSRTESHQGPVSLYHPVLVRKHPKLIPFADNLP